MNGDTFKEVVRLLPVKLREKMFREIWRGRIADKIDRDQHEKDME